MDVSQYLEIFLDETTEHLQNLNTQILTLEQEPENMDTINEIFRAAHSLKGMAGTMGYKRMQTLTHDMENVFSEVRNGNIKVNANMIDLLFQCLDALEEYTNNIRETGDEGTNENEPLIKLLNEELGKKDEKPAVEPKKEEKVPEGGDKRKWLNIKLDSTDVMVITEARKQGDFVYGATVYVQESCLLKAARAFLVFKAVEEVGEIIVSSPSAQDIEDEKFELDFSLIVISDKPVDKLIAAISNVSEIAEVLAEPIDLSKMLCSEEGKSAAPEQKKEEQKAVPAKAAAAPAADKKTGVAKQAGGKPIVNRTVRVDIEKLDVLMNLVSELIIAKNSLVAASNAQKSASDKAQNKVNEQIEYLESVTTSLHESVMKVRMVPIESVVSKFPRMIRDLTKKLDKKMELYMSGEETEMDRTVVDEIGDPLMHLLRNSADHGIESAEVRAERGKPEVGSIWLDAYQDGNNVVIEVRDDGNGIDTEVVKNKAISRGTITPEQAAANGVELIYANTAAMDDEYEGLMALTEGHGYDDVFVYVPNKQVAELGDRLLAFDGCMNFFAGPTDNQFKAEINLYNSHYTSTHILGTTGGNNDDLIEANKLAAAGKIEPAVMVTHVGGINSIIDTTLNLPKIPGGKKLTYTQFDMPLTAIDDFEKLGKTDPLFAKLDAACKENRGMWSAKAEKILFEHFGVEI